MESISHHIMPLVIGDSGCGHTHTPYTHKHTHTHTDTHTEAILRNQVSTGLQLGSAWFKSFATHPYFICQPAVRHTSTGHMDPVFSHNEGNHCLNRNLLYWRIFMFIAFACLLVVHSITYLLASNKGVKI